MLRGVTVCFNDGNGNWDNNGGKNYRLEAGTYFYSNGNLNKINTNSVHFTKFVVNNNKTDMNSPQQLECWAYNLILTLPEAQLHIHMNTVFIMAAKKYVW